MRPSVRSKDCGRRVSAACSTCKPKEAVIWQRISPETPDQMSHHTNKTGQAAKHGGDRPLTCDFQHDFARMGVSLHFRLSCVGIFKLKHRINERADLAASHPRPNLGFHRTRQT